MTPIVIVVMGVSGSGKTTVGRALADELHYAFAEGDKFHSAANIAKMKGGVPLDDADRAPWLESLNRFVRQRAAEGVPTVLTCSALRRAYRDTLRNGTTPEQVRFVYLRADRTTLARRLKQRKGHYMPTSLLDSQLETLEEPDDSEALIIDADRPVVEIVTEIRRSLFG